MLARDVFLFHPACIQMSSGARRPFAVTLCTKAVCSMCVWASYKAKEETPISKSCMFWGFFLCHCPAFHPDLCRAKGTACVTPLNKHFSHALFCFSFNCVENVLCSLSLFNRRLERRIGGKPCQHEIIKKKKSFLSGWKESLKMNCTLVMTLNGLNFKLTILKCLMEGDTGA